MMVNKQRAGWTANQIEIGISSHNHLVEIAYARGPEAASEHYRGLHLSGHPTALMDMIYWCAKFGWLIPQWAAEAFIATSDKVRSAEVGSWDDAFGRPYPGQHLGKVRRHLKSMAVYLRATELIERGNPINYDLFEQVGEEVGLAKTQCEKLYYEFKKREDNLRSSGASHFPKKTLNSGD